MFEFITVPLDNVAIELNDFYKYCYEVKVLNSIISDNKISLVLELILKGPNAERDYKRDKKLD